MSEPRLLPAEPGTYEHLAPFKRRVIIGDPPKCPYSRTLSYATWEYSIHLGWAEMCDLMDKVDDLWQAVEDEWKPPSDKIGEMFGALMEHLDGLREWTGWGGVPGEYTGEVAK